MCAFRNSSIVVVATEQNYLLMLYFLIRLRKLEENKYMTEFVSMHTAQDKIVDCRSLQFEFSFDNATQTQLRELAISCILIIQELLQRRKMNSYLRAWDTDMEWD